MRIVKERMFLPSARQLWEVTLKSRCTHRQGRPRRGSGAPSSRLKKLIALCVFIRGPKIYRPNFVEEEMDRYPFQSEVLYDRTGRLDSEF